MKDPVIQVLHALAPAASDCCEACSADLGRRKTLKMVVGVALAAGVPPLRAAEDGPRKGDWLVQVDDEAKKPLAGADVKAGEKPLIAYPFDPASSTVRDGTRLNRILLVRIDPAAMDAATAPRAADGVLAYSAFCTHQGCDVSSWVAAEKVLLCFCHFSKFAPHEEAAVTGGPAPRPLPALPLKLDGDRLVVADGFSAPPGKAA